MSAKCFAVRDGIHRFDANARCVYCGESFNPLEHATAQVPANEDNIDDLEFRAVVARVCESLDRYALAVSQQAAAVAAVAASAAKLAESVAEMAKSNGALVSTFFVAATLEEQVQPPVQAAKGVPRTLDDEPSS